MPEEGSCSIPAGDPGRPDGGHDVVREEGLIKTGALQSAIFNSANFSSIATDAKGVIQIFNVGAERMLGYAAGDVMNKITPADISDPREVIARAEALSVELGTPIAPGFEALVFKASRGIEDIYELTYIRKDGSRFPAVVSVTALRDAQDVIIGYLLIGTDNSARKQAEEALLKAGALQRAIFNSANFSSIATDAKGVIQIFNVGAERMLGYAAADVMNKITPADISDPREVIARAEALSVELGTPIAPGFEALVFKASRGIEDIYELTYIRKDGSRFPAVVSVTALRDAQDVIIGYLLIGTDNTARLRSETALRAMEAELRVNNELLVSVLENLPCGLSVFGADLHLVASNTTFRRLLDLPDELFDRPHAAFEDIVRFDAARGVYGADNVDATVRDVIENARAPAVPRQYELVRPDGTPLEIRAAPLPMGGFVTTYTDISVRRRADAEVQRSAQLLRGAIDAIDEAFVLFGPDDRLVFCNDKYRSVYAASSDLIAPGASFEEIERHGAEHGQYPAAIGRVDEWVAERVAAHQAGQTTLVQRLDDGRILRIIERKLPDGHTVGFRLDVTGLVHATDAAQEARAAAEAATVAKSEFLANMSHELRTPMAAVLGMLTLLRNTELTVRQADYAGKTEGAARSLLGLLNDILDFSKVEAGKMTLDPQPFRIDQLLRDLSVILSANAGHKRVEVLFDIDPTLPRQLVGDAVRLQQVLINLCGNAIKFTGEGEVVLSIAAVQRSASAVTVEFAVRDTGIGIAPENQARIFSGFTQSEASTTRRFGGTGLGLTISQRMVALMGGELRVDSALGAGSRFHFSITLPVARAPADDRAALLASVGHLRALVVDDNPIARRSLERLALSLGWAVDVADSGQHALDVLRARAAAGTPCQAVFLDWQMPGLDGFETSRRIRAMAVDDTAPIVVMVTAYSQQMLAQCSEAKQALLDGILGKPVTASMLFDAVVDARSNRAQPHLSRRGTIARGQRLAGMRLLVAEDNLNNQQVARELLEAEGASVHIAGNGQQAVDAVAGAVPQFDVLLMDLQMPVLDGFGATSRIRLGLGLRSLPIVAMTANAMASDREACLAAGMNDHVGKPFDLTHLVGVLRRLAGREEAHEAATVAPEAALPAGLAAAAAAAGVDIAAALNRLGGNMGLYRRMLRMFVDDLPALPAQLAAHVAAGETEPARRLLHTLKGQAGTLGATALAAAADAGERHLVGAAAAHVLADAARSTLAAVAAAAPGLATLLRALIADERPEPSPASPGSAGTLRVALAAMTTLLRSSDMAAMEAMVDLRRRFGATQGPAVQAIDGAIGRLEFERAAALCDELAGTLPPGQPAATPC